MAVTRPMIREKNRLTTEIYSVVLSPIRRGPAEKPWSSKVKRNFGIWYHCQLYSTLSTPRAASQYNPQTSSRNCRASIRGNLKILPILPVPGVTGFLRAGHRFILRATKRIKFFWSVVNRKSKKHMMIFYIVLFSITQEISVYII